MKLPIEGIENLVRGYACGEIRDEQMIPWLRDVFERGLSLDDTYTLTMAMAQSGDVIDWSDVAGPIVDKHSTGGVGDAVTLIAVPLAAACGVKVAKLSGRALGHSGGTIDKLECIPGLRTDLSVPEFRAQVESIGCAVAAASERLAPADKRLYALRHRTGLVASIPLIAASVMSKKIAAGAGAIVLDVKYGAGAFLNEIDKARQLADTMQAIGERAGRRVTTLLTSMEEPLANSVGDALELDEALSLMEGRGGSAALREVALRVTGAMLRVAGVDGDGAFASALDDGRALAKFHELAEAQGGSPSAFDRSWLRGTDIVAPSSGKIVRIDARLIGETIAAAKAGLTSAEASRAGVRLHRRVGDLVEKGQPLLTPWLVDPALLRNAVSVGARAPERA